MTPVALLLGYLIGSIPSAIWLGRLWGVDLRRGGSGNPGANNARRLGGNSLALLVLVVEMGKGAAAVWIGFLVAGEIGAMLAGLGAVAGNVYNVWYRFRGGKGLGITGGVLLALWPAGFPLVVVTIALASALTRSTGIGTLVTEGFLIVAVLAWEAIGLGNPWGLSDRRLLLPLVLGVCLMITPRHWRDARRRLSSPARP
ncbi:MAG TPA: glycerol-3-phosphate acyltransferase [Acidimicrobiia bacterium]|nr:glycerol-3-phosphate acyltransferase [Acidimicrobiia bacterium]